MQAYGGKYEQDGGNMSKFINGIRIAVSFLCAVIFSGSAFAVHFDIPAGDLKSALAIYAKQTGVSLAVSDEEVKGVRTKGVFGDLSADDAIYHILSGTGFVVHRHSSSALTVVRDNRVINEPTYENLSEARIASTLAESATSLETVTVTSSKIGGDVQNIPISITALSQEQLTATQTAGGPDLVKQVPNMTFTKTNFSGYSIQLRGIGTQAISVTTDPAVAVAFNDIPFLRNHFFEQEFYDVSQVEVLRGPQGTLYGRNATAGVVNLVSAKPTDQFEAMASADIGNYQNRRLEAMINIPIIDDRFDLRIAGEWTKRNGYTTDTTLSTSVDGRDLWSGRATLGWKPTADLQTYFVWEHFSEDDDRLRSGKQLCKTAQPPTEIDGVTVPAPTFNIGAEGNAEYLGQQYLSQSCQAGSLYSASAFGVPYGASLPYVLAIQSNQLETDGVDPYAEATQSSNLRNIQSAILPNYRAKNDTLEFNADYTINPALTFTSQTGFNQDFLWSTEDYNRFDTTPGIFSTPLNLPAAGFSPDPSGLHVLVCAGGGGCPAGTPLGIPCTSGPFPDGTSCQPALQVCDPQLGCSDRLVAEDLSEEHAWQLSQEFRLASNFSGPFNFSVGGNYLHYETEENYYVFANAFTGYAYGQGGGGASQDNCVFGSSSHYTGGYQAPNPINGGGGAAYECIYVDPNPLSSLNNEGHNYFLSQNPYTLNSYAAFGEATYNIISDLKLTTGLRWTDDRKHFVDIPSEVLDAGYGFWIGGIENQEWERFTGRAVLNWTPKLDFTDQTLVYASVAHGYKAGGANPPGAIFLTGYTEGGVATVDHPLTFKPEYIEAFELGTKNTLLDGALTLNGDVFYYNYTGYQISEIVDRTAINNNYNAHVEGAEIESNWEPVPGLRFNFAGGWEDTAAARGDSGIDLMDRTAGMPGWVVVKPFVTQASNCILPSYVVATLLTEQFNAAGSVVGYPGHRDDPNAEIGAQSAACGTAYVDDRDPATFLPYVANPTIGTNGHFNPDLMLTIPDGYPGFNPTTAPNGGEGFAKNLSGNQLPNAPPFTVSFGAQYTIPITTDWAGTLRGDYYWQDYSWARIFNDNPYDRLRGYTNVNLTLIFTNQNGWQVMGYVKNIFNVTDITGDFLNSDDSGLTTNVFLTDPRLIGIRVTKNW
jgi:iron complex outermembrane receptor protein